MTGQIKRIVDDRGFGFISGQDGTEYFFHRSDISNGSIYDMAEGGWVTFEGIATVKGPRAKDVTSRRQPAAEELDASTANKTEEAA